MPEQRARDVEVRPFPASRRFLVKAMQVGRTCVPMHGLLDVDVTEARQRMAGTDLSFTAFIVASVARAAAAHPEVHAWRNWRGRLVISRFVDVGVLIEIETPSGVVPIAHLVRDADVRDVPDITRELRAVKHDPRESRSGRLLARYGGFGARIPGFIRAWFWWMSHSMRMRKTCGTVVVSSVGMFAAGGGHVIGVPMWITLNVMVGGMSPRARVVDGELRIRDVLDLTVTLDHNVVDGAPAARFGADLRQLIERAEALGHVGAEAADAA